MAPSRAEALAVADEFCGAGAARVLLFGSVARGEAHLESDIDLVAVFDDIDYSNRLGIQLALLAIAERVLDRRVEVYVTDWPEWRCRTEQVSASFEARIAQEAVVLVDRAPVGVRWSKEIGLPENNTKEALGRLEEADKALEGVLRNAVPAELELAAMMRGDESEAVLRWERRMAEVCRLGGLAIETGLKALIGASGAEAEWTHSIEELVAELDGPLRVAVEDGLKLLVENTASSRDERYSDVSMWSMAGDYTSVATRAGTAARLAPLIADGAVEVIECVTKTLRSPGEVEPLIEMAARTSKAAQAAIAAGALQRGPGGVEHDLGGLDEGSELSL